LSVPVLVVTGPIGSGKSTVVGEVGDQLEAAGVAHATCDFDALTQTWPAPAGDRFNTALGIRNLACLRANCARAGAGRLVLGMTVETAYEKAAVNRAIPNAEPVFIRLHALPAELARRVRRRELGSARDWHLRRPQELAEIMETNRLEDAVVQTDGREVREIARDVLLAAGWLI
jgi:adenylylsulfate kinase